MSLPLRQFIASLTASGVVDDSAVSRHSASDAPSLAAALINDGKLTHFQADAFLTGRQGDLLFGDYLVLDRIGQGGMGVVYKAVHKRMKRIVALKVLPAESMKSPRLVQRFYREVQVAARLIHPHIVTAYDAGEHHDTHYLVMEFVPGRDLAVILQERGALPVSEAVEYILQAARGLDYAHSHGVIHRDIKPANLLLSSDGVVKILDMGLARIDEEESSADTEQSLTVAGKLLGTAQYMAPEQAVDAGSADHRADIYSLGCTLYRLISGKTPYAGKSTMEILFAQREKPIPSLRGADPTVPAELEAIYLGMVAKNPEDRFQSMREVIEALERSVRSGAVAEHRSLSAKAPAAPHEQRLQPIPVARSKGKTASASAYSAQPSIARQVAASAAPEALDHAVENDQEVSDGADSQEQTSDPTLGDARQISVALAPRAANPRGALRANQTQSTASRPWTPSGKPAGIPSVLRRYRFPLGAASAALAVVIFLVIASGGGGTPTAPPPNSDAHSSIPAGASTGADTASPPPTPIINSVNMKLVWIKPGSFDMGSPADELARDINETQHRVTLTKGFYIAMTEVTQAQWKAVMGSDPSNAKGDSLPVENVSWEEAVAFCRRLGENEGRSYRLPTEAEWEYACRAGTTTTYHGGKKRNDLAEVAWYGRDIGNSENKTHPVATKESNAWGLYDMHGNVQEWCADWFGEYPSGPVTDPTGPPTGTARVLRGGGYHDVRGRCRSASRDSYGPDQRGASIGFRVVMEESSASASVAAAPIGKPLDLLKLIDPTKDTVKGVWTNENGKLDLRVKQANQIEQFSRLTIPVVPEVGKPYRVRMKFSTPQNGRGIGVVLPCGKGQAMAGVASVGGLMQIEGKGIGAPGNPTTCSPSIVAGQIYTLDISVTPRQGQVEIAAKLDDKQLFQWNGKEELLSLPATFEMPHKNALGLVEWSLAPCTVHELTLEMGDGGKAAMLREIERD